MKNYHFFFSKALIILAFLALNTNALSQSQKFPSEFHYNTKTGKLVLGEQVTLTFLLSKIKSQADYQYILDKFNKQDGIRKVAISPLDVTNGTAVCSLTFNNKPEFPFKPSYLQKTFSYLGVESVYFDNDLVETEQIAIYMVGKEKQEYYKQNGK